MRDHDETFIASGIEARPHGRDRAYLIVLAGTNVGEMHRLSRERVVVGRGSAADIPLLDDGVSRAHAEISVRDDAVFIRDLGSRNGTYCNGSRVDERQLHDGDKIQLGQTTILKFTFSDELEESFQRQMYDSALRDGLTSAFNRRYFGSQLDSEFHFARRHGAPLSVVLFDLDELKAINDGHGHLAGDRVLAFVAHAVTNLIRTEDLLARTGGDEFAVLCRAIPLDNAARLAERLRAEIEARAVRFRDEELRVTVSVGAAALPESSAESPEALLAEADRALYRAKQGGRNRIEISRGG